MKNLLYPALCLSCGKDINAESGAPICRLCASRIRPNLQPNCKICGKPVEAVGLTCPDCRSSKPHYDIARSACIYEGPIKEMIHRFKYGGRISLGEFLTRLIIEFTEKDLHLIEGCGAVTFVPLHAISRRQRGFNQSKVLAEAFAGHFSIETVDSLVKTGMTARQNELTREERLSNLTNMFKCKDSVSAIIKGRIILLIDDVMTTGATFDECAKALRASGAGQIRCISVARGL